MGYQGAQTNVRAYVAHLRTSTAAGSAPRSRKQRAQAISPLTLRLLLARDKKDLNQEEQAKLAQLLHLFPEA